KPNPLCLQGTEAHSPSPSYTVAVREQFARVVLGCLARTCGNHDHPVINIGHYQLADPGRVSHAWCKNVSHICSEQEGGQWGALWYTLADVVYFRYPSVKAKPYRAAGSLTPDPISEVSGTTPSCPKI